MGQTAKLLHQSQGDNNNNSFAIILYWQDLRCLCVALGFNDSKVQVLC